MGKPTICICENKDADQLRGNRKTDQRLCFATRIVQFHLYLFGKHIVGFSTRRLILLASGMVALAGSAIRGEVYSWVAVVILPITSSVNPLIYTLLAALQKKVVSVLKANA